MSTPPSSAAHFASIVSTPGSTSTPTSTSTPSTSNHGPMSPVNQSEQVVAFFGALNNKALKTMTKLRLLPPVGSTWQPQFEKSFLIYSKLWKLQQQYRPILEAHDFKRSDVGELASRIAQLYYQYYLRTGELSYLQESFTFYQAIRTRGYYAGASGKYLYRFMRCYARFLLVCLMVGNEPKLFETLCNELAQMVNAFTSDKIMEALMPRSELQQWISVIEELKTFHLAANPLNVVFENPSEAYPLHSRVRVAEISRVLGIARGLLSDLSNRAMSPVSGISPKPGSALVENRRIMKLKLHSALIVSNRRSQVKYSELTLEGLRMMHSLEFEPGRETLPQDTTRPKNPHKALVYRPTFAQVLHYLSILFQEVPANKALLLYFNNNFEFSNDLTASGSYAPGGLLMGNDDFITSSSPVPPNASASLNANTNANANFPQSGTPVSHSPIHNSQNISSISSNFSAGDLVPFMRKPLFVIVDTDFPDKFQPPASPFSEPFVCLLSPPASPITPEGSFTLFLTNPIVAICQTCGLTNAKASEIVAAQTLLDDFNEILSKIIVENPNSAFARFIEDDFIHLYILRFVFSRIFLSLLKTNKKPFLPTSYPAISQTVFTNAELISTVQGIARTLSLDAFLQ